jgi:4-diphosphocytidyl-2-C-methyl-D-erythritol kinase
MTSGTVAGAVHVRAPAKVNVYLQVGALQEDGYHEVATAYQALGLYDEVHAYPADDFSLSFTGPVDTSHLETDASNLAIKAARTLARKGGYRGGVRLEIEKHIPIAAGLGGGSADAAGVLVACDALWGLDHSRETLAGLAAKLGADVPFALMGGTAVGTGRGDQLSPALAQGTLHWVLVFADFGLSTPDVYRALDVHRDVHAMDIIPRMAPIVDVTVLQALRAGDAVQLAEAMHNDLQAPVLALRPDLASCLELGERNGALAGIVSGSGPTLAFLAEDVDAALSLQVALSASGHLAHRVTGPVNGARLVTD